jgi:hypothetical protein
MGTDRVWEEWEWDRGMGEDRPLLALRLREEGRRKEGRSEKERKRMRGGKERQKQIPKFERLDYHVIVRE